MAVGFVYRQFKETTGPTYLGNEQLLVSCLDPVYAKKRWEDNKEYITSVNVVIPPNKTITINIPIRDEGEEDSSFEDAMLSDIRIDPKSRVIFNKLLIEYKFCHGGFFVHRGGNFNNKMDSKKMEVLQLMKDVILGYVRYEPMKLRYAIKKGGKKVDIEYDWDFTEDYEGVEYNVGMKKYKTNIYGTFTRKFRKMMIGGGPHKFYGDHELQYYQRVFDLNYGSINYLCASRESGKSFYTILKQSFSMFKSLTFKSELSDDAYLNTYFFTPSEGVISEYSLKLKKFCYNLLVKNYGLSEDAATQVIQRSKSEKKMVLHTANDDRSVIMHSQGALSPRGTRSGQANIDEANYLPNYGEVSEFATKSGAATVNNISTISKDSQSNQFYKSWTDIMLKTRNLQSIEEVIHHVWTKYGFDKLTSKEDYKQFVEDGVFDAARTEFYKLRPYFAMKATLDDVELYTEDEKQNKINLSVESPTGYDGMLAEYYCELPNSDCAIKYKSNIMSGNDIPRFFDKIYVGYDEAESYDDPTFVIGGINNGRLFVLEAHILTKSIVERFAKMKEIISFWSKKTDKKISVIMDIARGPAGFREASKEIPEVDTAIMARSGSMEKINNMNGISYYMIGTDNLVQTIMNNELIGGDKIFFSDALAGDGGLFEQLDTYVKDVKGYKGRGKKKDDLVSAMLYMSYYAYIDYIKNKKFTEGTKTIDIFEEKSKKFDYEQQAMRLKTNSNKVSLWDMR